MNMPVARAGCSLTRVCSPLPCWRLPVSQMAVDCGSGSHTLTSHAPTSELIVWVLNNSILMLHVGPRYFCFPSLLVWQPVPGGSPTPVIRALDRAPPCMCEMNSVTQFQWGKSSKGGGYRFWDGTMIGYVFHLLHIFFLRLLSHACWDKQAREIHMTRTWGQLPAHHRWSETLFLTSHRTESFQQPRRWA